MNDQEKLPEWLFEGQTGVFCLVRQDDLWHLSAANDAFRSLAGIHPRQKLGQSVQSMMVADLGFDLSRMADETILSEGGLVRRVRVSETHAPRWLLFQLNALHTPDHLQRVVGVCVEVSGLTEAAETLRTADSLDRYLSRALEGYEDIMVIAADRSRGLEIVTTNQAFTNRVGYTWAEAASRDPFFLLFGEEHRRLRVIWEQAVASQCTRTVRTRVQARSGRFFDADVVLEPWVNELTGGLCCRMRVVPLDDQAAPREISGNGQDHTTHRQERASLVRVTRAIINDFNNLLTIILGHFETIEPGSMRVALESVKFARRVVACMGEVILDLLRAEEVEISPGTSSAKASASPAVRRDADSEALTQRTSENLRPTKQIHSAISNMPESAEAANGPKLLVVEDERWVREMMCSALRLHRFQVIAKASGEEVMALVESGQGRDLDGVVVDFSLTGITGLDLIQWLRQREIKAPALIVSGYLDDSVLDQLKLLEIPYLLKPFQVRELVDAVHRVLQREPAASGAPSESIEPVSPE